MTYFLADCHLGAAYITCSREHEMRVVRFLNSIRGKASRLYLMGDILDFWWEYRNVAPQGFTRFFGALAALADEGVDITWLKGNHDIWISRYLPREIGFTLHDGPLITQIDGKRFFLEHGDGVGHLPWAFRQLRAMFRNRFLQHAFSTIHPRWGIALAHAWSSHSRKSGGYVPPAGQNSLVKFAQQYCQDHPGEIDYFLFGHQHVAVDRTLECGARVIVLDSWIRGGSYAMFDGTTLQVHAINED